MGTDVTERLRRALAQRHAPEGRTFLAAAVGLTGGDAAAAVRLGRWLAGPAGASAGSLDAWLRAAAAAAGTDPAQALEHRDRVSAALEGASVRARRTGPAARTRARDAVRVAVDA
ncbi:MAG: hypothetical protein R3F59_24805 [Myxococcota bacterium]